MLMARVVEPVVASAKNAALQGHKMLLVEIMTAAADGLRGTGRHLVCLDAAGAGAGELVLAVQGSSARMAESLQDSPTDAVIVGIVDSLHAGGSELKMVGS